MTTDQEFCKSLRIQCPEEWREPEQYYTYGGIIYDARPNQKHGRWPEWLREVAAFFVAALVFGALGFSICWWGSRP